MNFHLGVSKCFGILLSGTYKVELIRSFSEKSSSKIKEAVTRASVFDVDSNEQLRKYFSNKSRGTKLRQESLFSGQREELASSGSRPTPTTSCCRSES